MAVETESQCVYYMHQRPVFSHELRFTYDIDKCTVILKLHTKQVRQ